MKLCTACNTELPISDFGIKRKYSKQDGTVKEYRRNTCKKCNYAYRRSNHPWSYIKAAYKISTEEAKLLAIKVTESCEICGKDWQEGNKKFSIDHDHDTGKVRGVLCNSCNLVLGYAQDSAEVLKKATEYLEKHKV